MASWSWYLTDNTNALVALLSKVTARQITYKRNAYAEATATMLHSDPAATQLLSMLFSGVVPRLQAQRVGRSGVASCRFCGVWAPSTETLNDTATISLTFRSPFYQFMGDGSSRGRFTTQTANSSASITAAQLLKTTGSANVGSYTVPGTAGGSYAGLDIGNLDIGGASATVTPTYTNYNVGQGITDLTAIDGGIDFYERYSPDTTGGTGRMAYFDTYAGAGIGSDKSASLRFEYGPTTLNNCLEVTRGLDYPRNVITVLGANGLVGTAQDSTSRTDYGDWPYQVSATSISDQATLNNIAAAYLRTKPVKTIGFTPALSKSNCPQPFDDFDLGDTVMFQGSRDAFVESATKIQINEFTIGIDDDSGLETMTVTDPLDPDGEELYNAQIMGEVLSY